MSMFQRVRSPVTITTRTTISTRYIRFETKWIGFVPLQFVLIDPLVFIIAFLIHLSLVSTVGPSSHIYLKYQKSSQ